jgi:predicted nucleotidyltransferase
MSRPAPHRRRTESANVDAAWFQERSTRSVGVVRQLPPMGATPMIEIDGNQIDLAGLAEVCIRYGLAELAVFGSTARGEASRDCDVDLLYVLAPGAQLGFAINNLEDDLARLFGRKVDLVSKKAVHRLLRDEVVVQARTLYPTEAVGVAAPETLSTHRNAPQGAASSS